MRKLTLLAVLLSVVAGPMVIAAEQGQPQQAKVAAGEDAVAKARKACEAKGLAGALLDECVKTEQEKAAKDVKKAQ